MDWIDVAEDRDMWRALFACGNEISDFIKLGEFLDYLRNG